MNSTSTLDNFKENFEDLEIKNLDKSIVNSNLKNNPKIKENPKFNENSNLIFDLADRENNKKEQNCIKNIKLGKLKCYFWRNGEPMIVIGPHWPFFICLFAINLFIVVLFLSFLTNKVNLFVYWVGILISIIQLGSYATTALSNPGIPKSIYYNEIYNQSRHMRRCEDCNLLIDMELNTFHCYECEICVEGFDHHCPWTSKCIGEGNLKSFYTFVASTMILFGYLIFSVTLINPNYK